MLNGKESILCLEKKKGHSNNDWIDLKLIKIRNNLKYKDLKMIINKI